MIFEALDVLHNINDDKVTQNLITYLEYLIVLSLYRLMAEKPNASASFWFFSPNIFSGVTMMITPPTFNRRGIQKVNVFPEPVGEMVTTSLPSS